MGHGEELPRVTTLMQESVFGYAETGYRWSVDKTVHSHVLFLFLHHHHD